MKLKYRMMPPNALIQKLKAFKPRESHVARADHQRHQIIREAEQHRHAHQEDHGRAVHGEQLVEGLRRDEMIVRDGQLDAHDRGFQAADHQEQDAVDDVHQAELLVIDRDDPLVHTGRTAAWRPRCAGETDIGFETESALDISGFPMSLAASSSDSR